MKNWLTPQENAHLIAGVEADLERDRDIAMKSPMPEPATALGGVYCDPACHEIKPKYRMPRFERQSMQSGPVATDAAVHLK